MNSSGAFVWAKSYTYGSSFIGYSIARAASGNGVVLTGQVDVGNGQDIFVMEVDSEGELTSSAGTYFPTSFALSESSISLTEADTNGNPRT